MNSEGDENPRGETKSREREKKRVFHCAEKEIYREREGERSRRQLKIDAGDGNRVVTLNFCFHLLSLLFIYLFFFIPYMSIN